jgi:hypothetical protein
MAARTAKVVAAQSSAEERLTVQDIGPREIGYRACRDEVVEITVSANTNVERVQHDVITTSASRRPA